MKKLLLIAILMLALVFTVVACTDDPKPEDTTDGVTTVETPTTEEPSQDATEEPSAEVTTEEPSAEVSGDVTTEEPSEVTTEEPSEVTTEEPSEVTTEEPTADPMEPVLVIEPEFIKEQALSTGGQTFTQEITSAEVMTEGNRTFVRLITDQAGIGDPYVTLINIGDNKTLPQYMAISYRTPASSVEGQIFIGSGAGWSGQGDSFGVNWVEGDWGVMIIDLTSVGLTSITDGLINYCRFDFFAGKPAEGEYFDVQYVAFFNSVEAAEAYDFKVNPPYIEADDAAAGKVNHSFDTFYVNGQMYFPEDGGAGDKLAAQNNTITFELGEAHESMILRGWIGFGQPIESFGYYLDNYKMVFSPDFTKPTEDGVKAAGGEHASRFEIQVPLAALMSNDHFAGFVAKLADGTVVRLRDNIIIDLTDDVTDTFISDVASNEDGTDLQASDLANYFTIQYGAADPHSVIGGQYCYGGINEMFADMTGLYAFTVNMQEAANTAMMFVRGTRVVHSVDLPAVDGGLYPINNYYETDGLGRMGGAGIYAALYNGRLNLMIKAYDDVARTHIANKEYSIVADGTELTIADNGSTIYFLVDGNLYATVSLSGETSYEKICDLAEGVTFAQTAVVTLADGTTETIENTLVVSTYASQVGISLRPAAMKFDSVKVLGLSDVEIPAEFYVPEIKENIAQNKPVSADSVENENNIAANATDGDDATRWGALPNGAANLIVDLEEVYTLVGLDVLFENAGWNYEIALSTDGVEYQVIYTSEAHGGKMVKLEGEVDARYIKFSRLDDSADTSAPHWFSIYEVYVYAKQEETPDVDVPAVERYNVPMDSWVVTGHKAGLTTSSADPAVGAAGYEQAAMLHRGSLGVGAVDLSKYSKVVIKFTLDASNPTQELYAASGKQIYLLNSDAGDVMSPDAGKVVTSATYTMPVSSWSMQTVEIDLTAVDYNGDVYFTWDCLAGTFMLIGSIEFVG